MGIALSWLNITMPLANSLFLCYDLSVANKENTDERRSRHAEE